MANFVIQLNRSTGAHCTVIDSMGDRRYINKQREPTDWFAPALLQGQLEAKPIENTISDQEFETFWPLVKLYHNRYTLDLQILYSCQYISHEHEYIFYFFIVRLWKLTEASRSWTAFVSGDWNGCHIEVTVNCQGLDRVNAIDLGFRRSYSISEKSRLSRSADKESKFIEL